MSNLPRIPESWDEKRTNEQIRKIAVTLNQMIGGRADNVVPFSLGVDVTETTLTIPSMNAEMSFQVTAQSSNAASAIVAGLWVEPKIGKVIVHHDASPQTDRTFAGVFSG